jgi:choline dehydrogenase-like flavoprotein
VNAAHPDRLQIELNALATRVLFDDSNRAVGVEYLSGERLYRAHANPSAQPGRTRQAHASKEVILAGGAFNTPQLLMLSGIGPAGALGAVGIASRVDLPGVGRNLQDRYEVGVINRMNFECWDVLRGATFSPGDPQHREWMASRSGVYATNGSLLATISRSFPDRPLPDLFCFALLGVFGGYFPGYAAHAVAKPNYLTWAILKAHTENRAGSVTLRSADPRDTPAINFHYFEEGSDTADADLDAVVEGIRFVRKLTQPLRDRNLMSEEEVP